jgi:hypothetical protein
MLIFVFDDITLILSFAILYVWSIFEPAISASERQQTHGLDGAANVVGCQNTKKVNKWCGENMDTQNILLVVYLTTFCKTHAM